MFNKLTLSICLFLITSNSFAKNDKPDDHAPIGVMSEHIHPKGEFMTSYRYSLMQMKGLRNNQDKVSTSQTLNNYNYMMAPADMQMHMHMFGLMYGVTNKLTTSIMGSLVEKDMNVVLKMGADKQKRESNGYSDTKINSIYQFYNKNNQQSLASLGVSIPTGEIKETYDGTRLPYAMQIGSGSYELLPSLTYKSFQDNYSIGVQTNGVFRLDTNNNGYKLGDKYNITSWIAKNLNNNISVSTRLDYQIFEAIEGIDQTISNTAMIATRDTSLYDGKRLDLSFGMNYLFNKGILNNNRLAIEFASPIYQRLDGPQMEVDYKLTIGWQKVF